MSKLVANPGQPKLNVVYDKASEIKMAKLGTPTYQTVQEMQNIFHSAGWSSGGGITDDGDFSVTVAAGTGFIRATNSAVAEINFFDWAAYSSSAFSDNSTNWIIVSYNAGSPTVSTASSDTSDNQTSFVIGIVVRENGVLHITNHRQSVGDHAGKMIQRLHGTNHIARDNEVGGIILGETGTRNITVSTGKLWLGLDNYTIAALDTSGADTFDRYYRDGAGGWTKEASQTQWNNTQYDDGSGVLATMTGNFYSVKYFYIELDGQLVSLYGQAEYATVAQAQNDSPPSSLPIRLQEHGILIGRIIFQKSAASGTVQSAFTTTFSSSAVTDHGNLAGLTDDDHVRYFDKDGSKAATGNFDMNYNQLLRSAIQKDVIANIPNTGSEVDGQQFLATDICTYFIYCNAKWNPVQSFKAVTLYVDGTNGSDAVGKGYGSGASATATIQYAIDLIPPLNGGNVTVNIAAGSYSTEDVVIQGKSYSGNYSITIVCPYTVDTSYTVSSATNRSIDIATTPWTANSEKGKLCVITSGSGGTTFDSYTKVSYWITSNDTNTINLDGSFSTNPSASDTFDIVSLAVTIKSLTIRNQTSIYTKYVKISGSSGYGLEHDGGKGYHEGMEIINSTTQNLIVRNASLCTFYSMYSHGTSGSSLGSVLFSVVESLGVWFEYESGNSASEGIGIFARGQWLFRYGSLIDGYSSNGLRATLSGTVNFVNSGVNNVNNCGTGILAQRFCLVQNGTTNVAYSGNTTDYTENTAQSGHIT